MNKNKKGYNINKAACSRACVRMFFSIFANPYESNFFYFILLSGDEIATKPKLLTLEGFMKRKTIEKGAMSKRKMKSQLRVCDFV